MSLFDGLYLYEVVMLVGGSLLFLASLILLVVFAATGKPFSKLLLFFGISIVMIGFPAYSKIQISENGVDLEKDSAELVQNPANQQLRSSVSTEVAALAPRNFSDPTMLTSIAKAQIALGDNSGAQENVAKALQAAPGNSDAVALEKRLQLDSNLVQLTAKVKSDPNDGAAKSQLSQVVTELDKTPIASPVTTLNIAYAHSALGNQAQAAETVKKALQINPNLKDAVELQNKLKPGGGTGPM